MLLPLRDDNDVPKRNDNEKFKIAVAIKCGELFVTFTAAIMTLKRKGKAQQTLTICHWPKITNDELLVRMWRGQFTGNPQTFPSAVKSGHFLFNFQ